MINPLTYDHPGFIGAAYGLFFAVTIVLSLGARQRLKLVQRRLSAVDPRARRQGD
jgi:hypothetical protein